MIDSRHFSYDGTRGLLADLGRYSLCVVETPGVIRGPLRSIRLSPGLCYRSILAPHVNAPVRAAVLQDENVQSVYE